MLCTSPGLPSNETMGTMVQTFHMLLLVTVLQRHGESTYYNSQYQVFGLQGVLTGQSSGMISSGDAGDTMPA